MWKVLHGGKRRATGCRFVDTVSFVVARALVYLCAPQDGVLQSLQDEFAPFKETVERLRHNTFGAV